MFLQRSNIFSKLKFSDFNGYLIVDTVFDAPPHPFPHKLIAIFCINNRYIKIKHVEIAFDQKQNSRYFISYNSRSFYNKI